MRVLDLYSGLGGWSVAFRDRGHDVVTLDNDPSFGATLIMDARDFEPLRHLPRAWRGRPDVVVASPPCERFSEAHASHGRHWRWIEHRPAPMTTEALDAIGLLYTTLGLLRQMRPAYFVIENPMGLMAKLGVMPHERRRVWYCHLGMEHAKPTDLWGGFPPSLVLPPVCHNRHPSHGPECCCRDHVAAPRGARTGVQGMRTPAERGLVPSMLSSLVCTAAERDLRP